MLLIFRWKHPAKTECCSVQKSLFFYFLQLCLPFAINRTEYFNILQEWFYVLLWRCVNLKPHFTNVKWLFLFRVGAVPWWRGEGKNSMMSLYQDVCNSQCKSANLPTSHQSPALTWRNFEVEKTRTQAGQCSISVITLLINISLVMLNCDVKKEKWTIWWPVSQLNLKQWYFIMPHGKKEIMKICP